MIQIRIKKLEEVENPRHPNNIEVGFEKIGSCPDVFVWNGSVFGEPIIGNRFFVDYDRGQTWSTSKVVEIISPNRFRTLNSIYEWEKIEWPQEAEPIK